MDGKRKIIISFFILTLVIVVIQLNEKNFKQLMDIWTASGMKFLPDSYDILVVRSVGPALFELGTFLKNGIFSQTSLFHKVSSSYWKYILYVPHDKPHLK